jgi:hypothetical protein
LFLECLHLLLDWFVSNFIIPKELVDGGKSPAHLFVVLKIIIMPVYAYLGNLVKVLEGWSKALLASTPGCISPHLFGLSLLEFQSLLMVKEFKGIL